MSNIRRKFIAVLAVLFCALLVLSAAFLIPKTEKPAKAAAAPTLSNDIVDRNTHFINGNGLKELFTALSGSATYSAVESLFTSKTAYTATELTNKKGSEYNVLFGGEKWIPAYLSRTNGTTGDIILTLWLAQNSIVYNDTWNDWKSSTVSESTLTSNMYSTSKIRAHLIGSEYASAFGQTIPKGKINQDREWDAFIKNYGYLITTPENVEWQKTQSAREFRIDKSTQAGFAHDLPNECCGKLADGGSWAENNYAKWTYQNTYYTAWKTDEIWIPSMSETGSESYGHYGLWRLSSNQQSNTYSTWLRTGNGSDPKQATYLSATGHFAGKDVDSKDNLTIRPAFHFNITKAMKLAPEDITTTYTGSELQIPTIYDVASDDVTWYNATVYPISAGYVTYAYSSTVLNVGEYTVKMTLSAAATQLGYYWAKPDSDKSSTTINITVKKKPVKVKFLKKGTTDEIKDGYKVTTDESGTQYPIADYIDGEIAANDKTGDNKDNYPTLTVKYQNSSGIPCDSLPTKAGYYKAYAEITVANSNYELYPESGDYKNYIDFVIAPKVVAKPTLSYDGDLVYKASPYTITISSAEHLKYTVNKDDVAILSNQTAQTFEVKDAGVYSVIFSIADNDKTYYAWSDKVEANGSLDDADYTAQSFTIQKAELSISLDGSDNPNTVDFNDGKWGLNTQVKFKINITGEKGDDKVALYVYYTDKDGGGEYPASKQQDSDYYVILGQTEKGSGYKLYCKLADPTVSTNAVNGNYYIDYEGKEFVEKGFTVSTAKAPFKESDLKWQYKYTDDDGNHTIDMPENGHVTYNGSMLTVLLKNTYDDLKALGVKVDVSYGTNGYDGETSADGARTAAYVVTVKIVALNADYEFTAQTYTFNWYIDQAEYDLESFNIVWGYKARGVDKDFPKDASKNPKYEAEYEGGTDAGAAGYIEVYIASGLPDKLTVNLSENRKNEVGTYTATITGFTNTNLNYKPITSFDGLSWKTLSWKIVARELSTAADNWIAAEYADGKVTVGPKLDTGIYDLSSKLEYKYYANADRSGGELTVDDLKYDDGTEKTYYVEVFLIDSEKDNWILGNQDNPHAFEVGAAKTAVVISMTAGGEYDGEEKGVKLEIVTADPDINENSFKVVYYKDGSDTPLDGVPKDAGSYRAVVSLNDDLDDSYYIKGTKTINFEITKRVLEVPKHDGDVVYDGTEQSVALLCGLPEGWENYIEVSIVVLGGGSVSGNTVKTMGTYTVTFKIKDGINGTDVVNVEWNANAKTANKTVTLKVVQLVIKAKGWNEDGYYSTIDFEESNADKFVVYKVYDEDGNEVDEGTVYSSVGEMFTVEVSVGAEHGDNVRIDFVSGVTARYEFFTDGGEDPVQVALPTIADLTFNGENQTFVVNYGEFEQYIEIDLSLSDISVLSQFNAGEYTVYFKIKSGQNAVWADTGDRKSVAVTFKMKVLVLDEPQVKSGERFTYSGSAQSATLNIDAAILARFMKIEGDYTATNAGDYTFTLSIDPSFAGNVVWASAAQGVDTVKTVDWTIEKARVSVKWTQSGDVPELDIPEEFKDLDVEYEIRDENGNLVTPDQMEAGKTYTVTAKLKEGSAANYEFVDDSGKSLANPATTDGMKFEYSTGVDDGSSFPWWILAVAAGALLLILALIIIVVKKRQTADGEDFDDYYGEDYDYDEEEEIEEDGDDFDF